MRIIAALAVATTLAVFGAASPAHALVVLTFEGVGNTNAVGEFYNGGAGPDYNISFVDAFGLVDADAGGTGNFGGEPSPSTIVLPGVSPMTMNVWDGFYLGLGFFYTAPFPLTATPPLVAGQVRIWSDADGGGSLLATLNLPPTPFNGAPDPAGTFSPLVPIVVLFDGTARSATFYGPVNFIGFDDITLVPVPEPSALLFLGAGLATLALRRKLKA